MIALLSKLNIQVTRSIRAALVLVLVITGASAVQAQEASDRPNAEAGHGNVAVYTERGRYTAGYSEDAPKPLAEWVQPVAANEPASSLFEKRILPIFDSPKASSCTECHLGGVELKDYIFPSQEKTFAALLKGKMVNVEDPDASKILEFISRRPEKTSLVSDRVRQEEYQAFRSWLHAAVKDPQLLAAKAADAAAGPSLPVEVIRHARTDRVLASFVENVWSEMNRCSSCHSPETNQKQVERNGDLMSWIVPDDPLATLRYLAEEELIDVEHPEKSLLLTKPTLQTKHKGGRKMLTGDRSHKQFLAFVKDYAAMTTGAYTSTEQLPEAADLIPTPVPIILRVTGIPQRYADKPMQVDVYSLTEGEPSAQPVATATWPVIAKNLMWQFKLTLLTPRDAMPETGPRIHPGRYLAKIYIDDNGRLEQDPTAELGDAEFIGEVEFRSEWKPTPQNVTVIAYPDGKAKAEIAAVE